MQFNGKEMTAIVKMGKAMIAADGKVDPKEASVMSMEFLRFGATEEQVAAMVTLSDIMDAEDAVKIISALDSERKKYVAAFLGTIMAADGKIDAKELALWQLTSHFCSLPEMTVSEALDYMENLE